MNNLNIVIYNSWTPCIFTSSGSQAISRLSGTKSRAEDLLITVATTSSATLSAHRADLSQHLSTRSTGLFWTRLQPALSVHGMTAQDMAIAFEPAEQPSADSVSAADLAVVADALDHPARPSVTARDELAIDSLRNYELVRSIPVVVESLGDRHYVAEVPDLNISTSASSLSDILIVMKDRVTQTYDGLRQKKNLDNEQARQLRVLETYIGKPRRGWFERH